MTLLSALPVMVIFGIPLAAVPVVRLAHRRGLASGALSSVLAGAALFGIGWIAGDAASALTTALGAIGVTLVPAAAVGFLRAEVDPSRCYLGVCLAGCAFLAAAFSVSTAGPGPSLSSEIASTFEKSTPAIVEAYAKSGVDASTLDAVRRALAGASRLLQQYLWGILAAFWVVAAAVAFYAGAASARPGLTADGVRFDRLRVLPHAAWLFVACGAAFAALEGPVRRVAGNLLLPLLALYFVAGLSIICHFVRKWFRSRILRACMYVLACYFPLNVGVALLGLFDWYVDFRRRGEGIKGVEKS